MWTEKVKNFDKDKKKEKTHFCRFCHCSSDERHRFSECIMFTDLKEEYIIKNVSGWLN